MRRYETIVISHPSLSEEERQPFFDKLTTLILEGQGLLVKMDEWGQKRLAYEIKKQTRGYYLLMEYCGEGALVKELERNIRLDDRGLKYMTVCISEELDPEVVKAEIEAAQQEKDAAAAAAAAAATAAAEAAEKEKAAAAEPAPVTAPAEETQAPPVEEAAVTESPEETPETDKNEEATDGAHETE